MTSKDDPFGSFYFVMGEADMRDYLDHRVQAAQMKRWECGMLSHIKNPLTSPSWMNRHLTKLETDIESIVPENSENPILLDIEHPWIWDMDEDSLSEFLVIMEKTLEVVQDMRKGPVRFHQTVPFSRFGGPTDIRKNMAEKARPLVNLMGSISIPLYLPNMEKGLTPERLIHFAHSNIQACNDMFPGVPVGVVLFHELLNRKASSGIRVAAEEIYTLGRAAKEAGATEILFWVDRAWPGEPEKNTKRWLGQFTRDIGAIHDSGVLDRFFTPEEDGSGIAGRIGSGQVSLGPGDSGDSELPPLTLSQGDPGGDGPEHGGPDQSGTEVDGNNEGGDAR